MKRIEEKNNRASKRNLFESSEDFMGPMTEPEEPRRSRNFGKNTMAAILSYDNYEENKSQGGYHLFRSGSSLLTNNVKTNKEAKLTSIDNMKGGVVLGFGDSVRAENQRKKVNASGLELEESRPKLNKKMTPAT